MREYTSPPGFHRHLCGNCGCVWEHHESCRNNDAAHLCPCCGRRDWATGFHYDGPRRPTVSFPEEARPCES